MELLHVGGGSYVVKDRVVSVLPAKGAGLARLRRLAQRSNKTIDARCGQRAQCLILLDTGHVVVSARRVSTIIERVNKPTPAKTTRSRKAKKRS